jgi:hypothetical protein
MAGLMGYRDDAPKGPLLEDRVRRQALLGMMEAEGFIPPQVEELPPETPQASRPGEASLRPYEPTTRDLIARLLMGDSRASPERARAVEGLMGSRGLGNTGLAIADFVPGGQLLGAEEGYRESGAQAGALAMMPIPGAARGLRQVDRTILGKPETVKIPGTGEMRAAPIQEIEEAGDKYMRQAGRSGEHRIGEFPKYDEEKSKRIAEAYERMQHAPNDPAVRRSYEAMIDETLAQYKALKDTGIEFKANKPGNDPYAKSPSMGYADLVNNGRLHFFPTEQGYGTIGGINDNPLLKRVGTIGDLPNATANDAFRVVHDSFGHFGPGNPFFRAPGEERAWVAHSKMYSPDAVPAMTTETRGQNSWLNSGPHAEFNKTASGADTIYAEQKAGLMPDWTSQALLRDVTSRDATGRPLTSRPLSETQKSPDEIMGLIERRNTGHNGGPPLDDTGRTGKPGIGSTETVTMGGREPKDWSPGDWGAYGRAHGVPGLGPESDEAFKASLVTYKDKNGKAFTVPGGLDDAERPFAYYDLLHMKAQGINPNNLEPDVHRRLHNRMVRATQPGAGDDPNLTAYNGLTFGMVSPNQPLTPNELAQQRLMAKSPDDIKWMAEQTSWPIGENPSKDVRQPASRDIATNLDVQAKGKGGLGVSGSADYTRISDMAKMFQERPDFFRFDPATAPGSTPGEKWGNFVAKIASQVPGLSMKTGSLGTVWQDTLSAATSAVDRHMATQFHDDLFRNQKEQAKFEKGLVARFNEGRPRNERVKTFSDMLDAPGGRGVYVEQVLQHVNQHKSPKLRLKGGEENPRIPETMRGVDWVSEPNQVTVPAPAYTRALDANQKLALENEQGLFANQWMIWDRIRNRLEPHEIMYPGLQRLPRMTADQMKEVSGHHGRLGYKAAEGTVRPTKNASNLGYFSAGPVGLLGLMAAQDEQK